MGTLQRRMANELKTRADAVNPKREPLGIFVGPEGVPSPPGTKLRIITGPQATPEEQRIHWEADVLRGSVEISGVPEMSVQAITERWRAAGRALPDEPDYVPDVFERYYERQRQEWDSIKEKQEPN